MNHLKGDESTGRCERYSTCPQRFLTAEEPGPNCGGAGHLKGGTCAAGSAFFGVGRIPETGKAWLVGVYGRSSGREKPNRIRSPSAGPSEIRRIEPTGTINCCG